MTELKDTQLGALLVQAGVTTPEIIEQALEIQETTHLPLGYLLIDQGFCTAEQICNVLGIQRGLRSSARTHQALASADLAALSHEQHAPTIPAQTTRLKQISESLAPASKPPCKDG